MSIKQVAGLLYFMLLASYLNAAGSPAPYSLKGKIKGANNQYIYLLYFGEGQKQVLDSALIKRGSFRFDGQLPHPVFSLLYLDAESAMRANGAANVFLEPGKMEIELIKDDFGNARLSGSKSHTEFAAMRKQQEAELAAMRPLREKYSQINNAYYDAIDAKKDSATLAGYTQELKKVQEEMVPITERLSDIENNFVASHPDSYVSAYLLQMKVNSYPLQKSQALYNALSAPVQQSIYGREMLRNMEALKKGSPGSAAYYFARSEINGAPFNLADYKGKYILLDFWASWCVPCRAGNPHLIQLYKQYKNRGFEIVGISDDDNNHEAWKKAVDKDQIAIWKHVLRGFDREMLMSGEENPNDLLTRYAIHSLPTKILIDREGMIIGRYGGNGDSDEALDAKLAEIMPEPTAVNLKGYIKGLTDSVLTISWYDETGYKSESIPVKNERFSWTKSLAEPQKVYLNTSTRYKDFFIEHGDIYMEGTADTYYESKVTGSALQDENDAYGATLEPLRTAYYGVMRALHGTKEESLKMELEEKGDSISRLMDEQDAKYIAKNPSSRVSLGLAENKATMGEYDEVEKLYALLSPELQNTIAGKRLNERLVVLKRSAIGTPMKDFAMKSLNGKTVRLSDFKGKYVFVDFWASWCGPCRAENPNVLKAYNKYKNKNFTVLGVSLDESRDKWKAAVEKDKIPWIQISDLKGFNNELSSYYGIMAIPETYLVDPEGRIIAKGLRGAKLHQRLAEILK